MLSICCVSSEVEMGKKKNRFCLYSHFSCCSLLINPPGLYLAAAEEALSSAHQIYWCRVTHSVQNCVCFLHLQVLSLGKRKKKDLCCLCGCWSVSKCRREQGLDLLILFSHRGSEAQSAAPCKLIHSGWVCQLNASSVKYLACRQKSWWVVKFRLTLFTCINAGSLSLCCEINRSAPWKLFKALFKTF